MVYTVHGGTEVNKAGIETDNQKHEVGILEGDVVVGGSGSQGHELTHLRTGLSPLYLS